MIPMTPKTSWQCITDSEEHTIQLEIGNSQDDQLTDVKRATRILPIAPFRILLRCTICWCMFVLHVNNHIIWLDIWETVSSSICQCPLQLSNWFIDNWVQNNYSNLANLFCSNCFISTQCWWHWYLITNTNNESNCHLTNTLGIIPEWIDNMVPCLTLQHFLVIT